MSQTDSERELQPGVYDTGKGSIRMDVREILVDRGIAPTEEAIRIAADGFARAARELGLPTEVTEG